MSSKQFGPNPSSPSQWPISRSGAPRLLELSAGRSALWSAAVRRKARPPLPRLVSADLSPPLAPGTDVQCIALDNARLLEFAEQNAQRQGDDGRFDVIYGSHMLCTCRWVSDPAAYLGQRGRAVTCGGLRVEPSSVRHFARGISALLTPSSGIAVFDQEGGWPFGLERMLRSEASAAGLYLYTRRGPLWTNFNYVLSAAPLSDDVSPDPLQQTARAADVALILCAGVSAAVMLALANREALSPEALAGLRLVVASPEGVPLRKAISTALTLRLILPFANVLTLQDVVDRLTMMRWRRPD